MAKERQRQERRRRVTEGGNPHHEPSPRHADEQDSPEPERPTTPDEEQGQSLEDLDEPPQAEGPRKDAGGGRK